MTHTVKFNLSTIMTRAWSQFRNRILASETFADCLRRAWAYAKAYASSGKASPDYGVSIVNTSPAPAMSMAAAIAADYAQPFDGYGRRRYFGD